jgi:hypothetical protein
VFSKVEGAGAMPHSLYPADSDPAFIAEFMAEFIPKVI